MNEQIKQLAEQAKLKTELWNNPEPFVIYKEDVNYPGGLEKFAELIVRECMNVLDPGEHQLIARFQARKWLAEHFGVEE